MTPDVMYDQVIGTGCARRLFFSWGGNPGVGSLHRLRDAVVNGYPHPLELEPDPDPDPDPDTKELTLAATHPGVGGGRGLGEYGVATSGRRRCRADPGAHGAGTEGPARPQEAHRSRPLADLSPRSLCAPLG